MFLEGTPLAQLPHYHIIIRQEAVYEFMHEPPREEKLDIDIGIVVHEKDEARVKEKQEMSQSTQGSPLSTGPALTLDPKLPQGHQGVVLILIVQVITTSRVGSTRIRLLCREPAD
jgi:hypothetical protein